VGGGGWIEGGLDQFSVSPTIERVQMELEKGGEILLKYSEEYIL
jgi:hypothetical protein